jgi:hypothetical protein
MDAKTGGKDRVTMDCRTQPGSNCSLTISGTENEVLELGEYHAATKHGEKKEGLRDKLRSSLKHEALAS